jgi:hypothetical protein
MNRNKWILKNGVSTQEYDSFPLAFRVMFLVAKKASETGKFGEISKGLTIISPVKDVHGEPKKYSYAAAIEFATASEVLTATGEINTNVFRKKNFPRGQ